MEHPNSPVVERTYFSGRTKDGDQYFYLIDSDGESFKALPAGRRRISIEVEVDSDGSVLRSYRLAGVESGSR